MPGPELLDQVLQGQHFAHGHGVDPDRLPVRVPPGAAKPEPLAEVKALPLEQPETEGIYGQEGRQGEKKQEGIENIHY
jgi:hypothetical protein